MGAAGLTLKAEHCEPLTRAFEAATRASCDAVLFERTIAADGPLAADDLTLGLIEAIERQIWGQGFPPPLFANEFAVAEQRLIKEQHLRLTLELQGRRFNAIWFRRAEALPSRVMLVYRPAVDEYQEQRRVQLLVESRG